MVTSDEKATPLSSAAASVCSSAEGVDKDDLQTTQRTSKYKQTDENRNDSNLLEGK